MTFILKIFTDIYLTDIIACTIILHRSLTSMHASPFSNIYSLKITKLFLSNTKIFLFDLFFWKQVNSLFPAKSLVLHGLLCMRILVTDRSEPVKIKRIVHLC